MSCFVMQHCDEVWVMQSTAGDLSLWMAPAYNFETIFNLSKCPLTSMSFSHNQVCFQNLHTKP
jgi:hypothetical protein